MHPSFTTETFGGPDDSALAKTRVGGCFRDLPLAAAPPRAELCRGRAGCTSTRNSHQGLPRMPEHPAAAAGNGDPATSAHVVITAGPFRFLARLEEEAAPRTCAAFREMLPFASRVIHARWSGE